MACYCFYQPFFDNWTFITIDSLLNHPTDPLGAWDRKCINSWVITLFDNTFLGHFIQLGRLHILVIPPTWVKVFGGFIWGTPVNNSFLENFEPMKWRFLRVIFPQEKKLIGRIYLRTQSMTHFANFWGLCMSFLPLKICWEDSFQHFCDIHIIQSNILKIGLFSQFKHVRN